MMVGASRQGLSYLFSIENIFIYLLVMAGSVGDLRLFLSFLHILVNYR